MQGAYSLNCLNKKGGIISQIVTRCATIEAAISKAIKELPGHCAKLRIARLEDESTAWEGSTQEAKRVITRPSG